MNYLLVCLQCRKTDEAIAKLTDMVKTLTEKSEANSRNINKMKRKTYASDSDEVEVEPPRQNKRIPLIRSGTCLLYTSPSPRDKRQSRMPSSA